MKARDPEIVTFDDDNVGLVFQLYCGVCFERHFTRMARRAERHAHQTRQIVFLIACVLITAVSSTHCVCAPMERKNSKFYLF